MALPLAIYPMIGAGMALGGAGAFTNWFGLGGKKQSQNDPLAGLRASLQAISSRQEALAGQVPGLVAKQKELLGQRFGEAKTEGIRDIGENVYAERGFGKTSIYDRLRTELIDKLAKSQAEAELEAEFGGLKLQGDILGQAGTMLGSTSGMYPAEEGPSFMSKLLGAGAGLVGQEMGYNRLKDIISPEITPKKSAYSPTIEEDTDWIKNLSKVSGSQYRSAYTV